MKISVEVPEDIGTLLPKAKEMAMRHGGKIEGDETHGSFAGKGVSGSYTVSGRTVTAFVGRVPPFVTEKRIREELELYFSGKSKLV
jgi:hypothetical protein